MQPNCRRCQPVDLLWVLASSGGPAGGWQPEVVTAAAQRLFRVYRQPEVVTAAAQRLFRVYRQDQ